MKNLICDIFKKGKCNGKKCSHSGLHEENMWCNSECIIEGKDTVQRCLIKNQISKIKKRK